VPNLSVDGVQLYYEERGQGGVPVVFSHGLLWSGRMFEAQMAALSPRHRCIAYDHRGQGRSATSPVPYDMERLAADGAAVIEQLGAGPCHFVGLSMGGFVGLRLAIERPELIRTLTLVESAADPEPRWNVPKYRVLSLVGRRFGYRPLLPAVMRIMFGRTFLADRSRRDVRAKMEAELVALEPLRVDAALDAVIRRRALSDAELSRIKVPTQVVHGDEDKAIVTARAARTARAIPGCKLVNIPRAGHTSSVEAPEAVARALADFFEAHA
jgi:3-oxoadipate enol-lactonase